jgi:uroporphyrinogen-III decarboxylase
MNARERLLKTLRSEPTDRIPISPFMYYNNVYELFDYVPDIDDYYDPPDFDVIQKYVEYCDHFGYDVLHTLGSVWDFYTMTSLGDQSVVKAWDNWDVNILDQRKGDNERLRTITIQTPGGTLRHVEKLERTSKYLVITAPLEYLIKTKEDFDIFRKYAPPADTMDCRLVRRARQAVGDRGLVTACTNGAFNILMMFRKLDQVLMDPYVDRDLFCEMRDYLLPRLIQRAVKLVENGADVVEIGAHLSGQVSPRFYEEYILPYENQLVRAVHQAGGLVIYHNCGKAAKQMHLYNRLDIDCWGYLTPPPGGDVMLDEVLRVMRPNLALRGNIDQVEFLRQATPEQVREAVRGLLLKVKPRGNWILSTTDFLFDGTPLENVRALVEAGKEYGQY